MRNKKGMVLKKQRLKKKKKKQRFLPEGRGEGLRQQTGEGGKG